MSLRYLLDTNAVSELAKRNPAPGVARRFAAYESSCALSAPSLEELTFGVARLPSGARRTMLRKWLDALAERVEILSYDARAAHWLGIERARLSLLGKPAPRTDGEIAAIAVTQHLTLVTRNTGDFKAFDGLSVENWHEASG